MGERLSFSRSTTDRIHDPGPDHGHVDLDLDQDQSDHDQDLGDHDQDLGDHSQDHVRSRDGLVPGHDPRAQNQGNPAGESPGQGPRDLTPDQDRKTERGRSRETGPKPNPSLVQNPDTNCGIYLKLRRVQIVMIFDLPETRG